MDVKETLDTYGKAVLEAQEILELCLGSLGVTSFGMESIFPFLV